MATVLVVETYQVCAGVDASDPAPTVLGPAFRTREAADRHLVILQTALAEGVLVVPGAVLFVRPTPGNQSIPVSEPATAETLRADLSDARAQVVIWARVQVDGVNQHIRLGSLPARLVATLST